MREKIFYTLLSLTLFGCVASEARAETQIINNITSSASSGGNQTDGGTIETGDATASVKVENRVNNDDGEESGEIKVKSEIKLQANEKQHEETIKSDEPVEYEKTLTDEGENGDAEAGIEIKTQIMPEKTEPAPSKAPETTKDQEETQKKNFFSKIIDLITSIFK